MVVLQSPPPVLPLKFIRTIKARMPTISKVNINNKINMTTQNDTQNMSPVLIEDIDPAAEDSLDYESMEGPELGHSDDEGEVNSGRVEVNALVQQEKGNFVYKEADSMGHFQAATQTMSQVQQQQNIT
ncbi:hypothetical protein KY284_035941 [Solanum tuberosum]|nr:hypothetical protein KY284_035941 [Solanum tuberosum]